jgi:hypothetical protein
MDSSRLYPVQTGYGVHLIPYPMSIRVERPERETDHSLPSNTEVKAASSFIFISPYVLI